MPKVPRLRSPALETSLSRPISSGRSDGLSYKAQCLELDMWYLPGQDQRKQESMVVLSQTVELDYM